MNFKPEAPVTLNINGREYFVCPEQRGKRYCFRLDGGRLANVDDVPEQRDVLFAIEDMFRGAGQSAPEITFRKMIPSVTFGEAFAPAFEAMKRARSEWGQTTEARAELVGNFPVRRGSVSVSGERVLDYLCWFFDPETQYIVKLSVDSLRERARAMREAGCSQRHVAQVGIWRAVRTLAPVFWDGCVRLAKSLPVLGAVLRTVAAWLRKIDPPRPV